jgi:hypothetical protein
MDAWTCWAVHRAGAAVLEGVAVGYAAVCEAPDHGGGTSSDASAAVMPCEAETTPTAWSVTSIGSRASVDSCRARTSTRMVSRASTSTAKPPNSPSPWAAWTSPSESSPRAGGRAYGRRRPRIAPQGRCPPRTRVTGTASSRAPALGQSRSCRRMAAREFVQFPTPTSGRAGSCWHPPAAGQGNSGLYPFRTARAEPTWTQPFTARASRLATPSWPLYCQEFHGQWNYTVRPPKPRALTSGFRLAGDRGCVAE